MGPPDTVSTSCRSSCLAIQGHPIQVSIKPAVSENSWKPAEENSSGAEHRPHHTDRAQALKTLGGRCRCGPNRSCPAPPRRIRSHQPLDITVPVRLSDRIGQERGGQDSRGSGCVHGGPRVNRPFQPSQGMDMSTPCHGQNLKQKVSPHSAFLWVVPPGSSQPPPSLRERWRVLTWERTMLRATWGYEVERHVRGPADILVGKGPTGPCVALAHHTLADKVDPTHDEE